jgi:hypothetical protein
VSQELNKKRDAEYKLLLDQFAEGRRQYGALKEELVKTKGTAFVIFCL